MIDSKLREYHRAYVNIPVRSSPSLVYPRVPPPPLSKRAVTHVTHHHRRARHGWLLSSPVLEFLRVYRYLSVGFVGIVSMDGWMRSRELVRADVWTDGWDASCRSDFSCFLRERDQACGRHQTLVLRSTTLDIDHILLCTQTEIAFDKVSTGQFWKLQIEKTADWGARYYRLSYKFAHHKREKKKFFFT